MDHSSFALLPLVTKPKAFILHVFLHVTSRSLIFLLRRTRLIPLSYYGVSRVNLPLSVSYSHQELLSRCAA